MNNLFNEIEVSLKEAQQYSIQTAEQAEQFRIHFLGSKGILKKLMAEMKQVPAEQKKEAGQALNSLKQQAEEKYKNALEEIKKIGHQEKTISIDWSLPGKLFPVGAIHPLTKVRNEIISIFQHLGFAIAEGPEVEDDWHNFGAMNLPENHPARDMQDTFYISQNPDWLLRTHTSSVQARVMEQQQPPIRVVCPGRVYRNETISARAHCFFHQVEGLYVDTNVSLADLKQTLYFFVQEMFGNDTKIRFRPSYFPFTEPSAEMDVTCLICKGKGCSVCKHTGWVEILGCGMVHPNVLNNCGISSEIYTGFAFGMGIERLTMLRYQINDLRLFSENDIRFLQQFSGSV